MREKIPTIKIARIQFDEGTDSLERRQAFLSSLYLQVTRIFISYKDIAFVSRRNLKTISLMLSVLECGENGSQYKKDVTDLMKSVMENPADSRTLIGWLEAHRKRSRRSTRSGELDKREKKW